MTSEPIVLEGCAPTPLAGYLKALGVFRLVATQADADARGWWQDERFHLATKLSREELLEFFAERYQPSPIISPWNGRAGFLEGLEDDGQESTRKGAELVRKYQSIQSSRFAQLRDAVEAYHKVSIVSALDRTRAEAKRLQEKKRKTGKLTDDEGDRLKYLEREIKRIRGEVFNRLRSEAPDAAIDWFDACRRAGLDNTPMPLLGSGGLDGSRDFGMSFGESLDALFDLAAGKALPSAAELVDTALFDVTSSRLSKGNAGQYAPGAAGENLSTSFSGEQPFNPAEMVLLLEGAMLFYGAASRRLGSATATAASFPFTVEAMTAGSGGTAPSDDKGFAEFWAPIWHRPASFLELKALFTEGRAAVGSAGAMNGLQFAVAVHTLGIGRGITEFQRYGLLQREPRNPRKATPLGRARTADNPRASLVSDLDRFGWLGRVRSAVRGKGTAASLLSLGRQLDEALFRLAGDGSHEAVQEALIAIGTLAVEAGRRPKLGESLPPPRLSVDWLDDADDGSPAFAIARALATLDAAAPAGDGKRFRMPFRRHLAPLKVRETRRSRDEWDTTTEAKALVVWTGRDALADMAATFGRRLVEAERRKFERGKDNPALPLSGKWASLEAVAAFLRGEVDLDRIAALAAGLAWVDRDPRSSRRVANAASPETENEDDNVAAPNDESDAADESDANGDDRVVDIEEDSRSALSDADVGSFAFAALKPLFDPKGVAVPRPAKKGVRRSYGKDDRRERKPINPLPLFRLVETGRVDEAVVMAQRVARGAGLSAPFADVFARPIRAGRRESPRNAERLAAALLIPLSDSAIERLANRAYPETARDQEDPNAD